jgi:hypothetical protein
MLESDLRSDERLSPAKRRLLVRVVRQARRDFWCEEEPVKLLGAAFYRAYYALVVSRADAVTTVRAVDSLVRLGRQLGLIVPEALRKRRIAWATRVEPPTRTRDVVE